MIKLKEITDRGDWNPHNISKETHFTQSYLYGEIQSSVGRKVIRYSILLDDMLVGFVQFIEYPLFAGMTYWYAPYGPVLNRIDNKIIAGLKSELSKILAGSKVVFARLDFCPALDNGLESVIQTQFTKSATKSSIGAYFQPRNEWFTDINKTPEEILTSMHQKTRYSVRYAEKKGIKTEFVSKDLLSCIGDFMRLMKSTSQRNGFSLHSDEYYKKYFKLVESEGNAFLAIAKYGEVVLAMHLIVIYGGIAHYVFGASSNEYRELCAPYLLHFNSMLKSKEFAANYYNFGAVSVDNENNHWGSLTVFKQKFGGSIISHSSLFDLVNKKFWYYIYIARKLIKSKIR